VRKVLLPWRAFLHIQASKGGLGVVGNFDVEDDACQHVSSRLINRFIRV
jgi:hypothetical protein